MAKTKLLSKEKRDAITRQALSEIAFARNAKRPIIAKWHKNEDLYYSRKLPTEGERANVNLNEAQSFVNTFLSKINSPFDFKFVKGEEADLKAAKMVNAIKDKDAKKGRWNYKAMLARTQMIIYGRYIFEYHADSIDGYQSHLNNVDVYQFLIDPSCGGLDIEQAFYLGRGGIIKSKKQIEEGIKSGKYLRTEGNELISGSGDADGESEEDKNAKNRWVALLTQSKTILNKDQWKLWEWYTTYEGVRYYVFLSEDGGKAIRIVPLKEMFAKNKWPFFSVAAYPDLTEFWTPSPLDGVREAIMAKATSINQMLDNSEAVNRPMKAFDVDAIKNPALLKYRRDGNVPMKGGTDINKALQFFPVVPINAPLAVYDKLSTITDVNSGVNAGAKGQATEDKVGIYEGNQANAADRFSLIGDSEADGQERFASLYLDGLDEHMTGKIAVEMIGIDGVEYVEVTKKDLKRNRDFDITVITAGTEETMQGVEKRNKLVYLQGAIGRPTVNQTVREELEASIAGLSTDEIKRLLDTKNEGDAELMSECIRDIERVIAGKVVPPNELANNAYKQKIVHYMRDQSENLKPEQKQRLIEYVISLEPIIFRNMQTSMNETLANEGLPSIQGQMSGMSGQAMMPGMEGDMQEGLPGERTSVDLEQEQSFIG